MVVFVGGGSHSHGRIVVHDGMRFGCGCCSRYCFVDVVAIVVVVIVTVIVTVVIVIIIVVVVVVVIVVVVVAVNVVVLVRVLLLLLLLLLLLFFISSFVFTLFSLFFSFSLFFLRLFSVNYHFLTLQILSQCSPGSVRPFRDGASLLYRLQLEGRLLQLTKLLFSIHWSVQ